MKKETIRTILSELYYKRDSGYVKLSDPKYVDILDDYSDAILKLMLDCLPEEQEFDATKFDYLEGKRNRERIFGYNQALNDLRSKLGGKDE